MAEEPHNTGDVQAVSAKEDAETTAARRELQQTTISETAKTPAQDNQSGSEDDGSKGSKAGALRITPDSDLAASKDSLRERVASPKKKRAHDELADGSSTSGEGSSKPPITAVTQTSTEASEPEKKRHRDGDSTRRRSRDAEVSQVPCKVKQTGWLT